MHVTTVFLLLTAPSPPPSSQGVSREVILAETREHLAKGELDWEGGAMSGTLYNNSKELSGLMTEVPIKLMLLIPLLH